MNHLVNQIKGRRAIAGAVILGYASMGCSIVVQLLFVPIYLRYLGQFEFGVLMLLLSFINFASMGIGWMSGGMQRILGEYAAVRDDEGFARAYSLCKVAYCAYAAMISIAMVLVGTVGLRFFFPSTPAEHVPSIQYSVIAAAVYFVVYYEFSVERLALASQQRLAAGYFYQIVSQVAFAIPVYFWLRAGGGLKCVLICLLAGIVVARIGSGFYWRGTGILKGWYWPGRDSMPMLRRLTGTMGRGYMLYGPLLLVIQSDYLLVGKLGGAVAVAQFTLVWRLADALSQVICKVPEFLTPYLFQMDARGEHARMAAIYRRFNLYLQIVPLAVGIAYAFGGYWVMRHWVGPARAIDNPAGFAFAGAAIFWISSARLPSMYAFSTVNLKSLNTVAAFEAAGKVILTVLLYPKLSYLAPMVATTITHAGGVAIAYRRLVKL
ncbi:MAG TPA: hypothetical protein VKT77_01880 [Chthonomonadaceae bacterium]|nr:hypothetical protein [Chthonomonadaceae bacterium]